MHIQVRRARVVGIFAVLGLAVGGLVLVGGGGASADTAPLAGTPATVSADALPTWQVNGVVWQQVVVGNTAYATGSFTKARPPGVAAGGAAEVPANNIFAYDLTTGDRVASFNHSLNGQGLSISASPDSSRVYVGGDFTTVDGIAHNHLAAFSTANNTLVSSFAPSVSSTVEAIAATNSHVFFGGNFFSVNGTGRTRLAQVNASNGSLTSWKASADNDEVKAMVLSPDGSRLVVGGAFSTLNGKAASGMGALSSSTGASMPWAASQTIKDSGAKSQCAITSLRTDGTSIYGSGFSYGCGNFEGSFKANPTTGAVILANDCHGDTYDVAPIGGVLYTVSHAHDCSPIRAFPQTNADWQVNMRHALAFTTDATTTNTGPDSYGWNYKGVPASSLLQWYPQVSIGTFTGQNQAAWAVAGNSKYVVLGGEFPAVNGVAQQGLVRFAVKSIAPNKQGPTVVTTSTAPNPPVTAPSAVATGAGSVQVTWQSAVDQDNGALTYKVSRQGAAQPVYTTTATSNYWTYPTLGFLDKGLAAGTKYTYVITATDPSGNATTLGTVSATTTGNAARNVPPTASFSSSVSGATASVDGSGSTDTDGTVASYAWDWGDGSTAGSGVMATHTYGATGTYPVKLTVTDDKGATGTISHNVTVTAAAPGAPTTLATDSFGRTQASGWGSADLGGSWALRGSTSHFSVGSGAGSINLAAPGSGPSAYLDEVSSTKTDTTVTLSANKAPTGGGLYISVSGREVPAGGGYSAELNLRAGGSVSMSLLRVAADGSEATVSPGTVVPGLTYTPGAKLNVRFVASGSGTTTLKAKVWASGTSEPANWLLSGTDTTAGFQSAGTVGLMAYLSGGATNAPVIVNFYNFATVTALD